MSNDLITLHDSRATIVWINAPPPGLGRQDLIGKRPWDAVPEADRPRIKGFFGAAITAEEPQRFEVLTIFSGREIRFECRLEPTGVPAIPIIAMGHVLDSRVSLLTHREREIALLTAEGLSAKQVGRRLGISGSTVDTHRCRIREKLRVRSIADIALFALKNLHS